MKICDFFCFFETSFCKEFSNVFGKLLCCCLRPTFPDMDLFTTWFHGKSLCLISHCFETSSSIKSFPKGTWPAAASGLTQQAWNCSKFDFIENLSVIFFDICSIVILQKVWLLCSGAVSGPAQQALFDIWIRMSHCFDLKIILISFWGKFSTYFHPARMLACSRLIHSFDWTLNCQLILSFRLFSFDQKHFEQVVPSLCCSFQLSNCYNRHWMVKFLDMLKRYFPFDKHLK